jgi:His/Glu/Gln/Arg/opine family amino acid ABC transporter permease subunit
MARVLENFDQLWAGLLVTIKLLCIICAVGFFAGIPLGIAAAKWKASLGRGTWVITYCLMSIPALVFLYWLHYPFQQMLGIVINPFVTTVVTFSIINTFAIATTIRTAIGNLPAQYGTASKVCGMSPWESLVWIEGPLVFRSIVSPLISLQVNMLHATLFASLLGVEEIFRVVQRLNAKILQPIPLYTMLAILFLVICLPVNVLALWLRHRFSRDYSEVS